MCGIAGFFNYKTGHAVSEENLISVLQSMRYRGPDNIGIYADADIAMGNVRLAIQGLSGECNQPIYNESKSVVVVYNGEIYNFPELRRLLMKKGHLFYTNTDTEVLVHLYEDFGTDMANEINGMFAFALFDVKERVLLLGRDRSAQKPLYINRNENGVFFSSEIKSMIPYLRSSALNPVAVRAFLSLGYALEPSTVLAEVEALEPGTIYSFSYDGSKEKSFRDVNFDREKVVCELGEWKERADFTMRAAVRRHLLSDVPVSLLLSGGIDSSLLSLYLKDENQIKKAFAGSFIGHKDHDEYGFASKLGQYCGFEVERVCLSNRILSETLEEFLSRASMPQGDYSGLATYCISKEIAKEYRVVLGGDGGDELFGGYPTYTFPYLSKRYSFIPKDLIKTAHYIASIFHDKRKYLSLPFKLQQLYLAWGADTAKAHFLLKNFLPDAIAAELLEESFLTTEEIDDTPEKIFANLYESSVFTDPARKLCWIDFNTFLRSGTIPKVERNSMLFSLENRLPYLDNEIVNLSIHTDSSLMIQKTETKKCLKSLLRDKVQGKIDMNPKKQGFSPPLVDLFDNELRLWKEHWLNIKMPFLSPHAPKVLSKWRQSKWDLHRLEWHICSLADWCYRNNLL